MSLISVPSLVADGKERKEILPAFRVEDDINNYGYSPLQVYKTAPILAQHRHAFSVSREYRYSIFRETYKGECSATFREPRQPNKGESVTKGFIPIKLINRPARIFKRNGIWVAEYDSKDAFDVLEPPEGWVTAYTRETGYPEKTGSLQEAMDVFGNDASHFYANRNDLRAVGRVFDWYRDEGSPFVVVAGWRPDSSHDWVGSRSVFQGPTPYPNITYGTRPAWGLALVP